VLLKALLHNSGSAVYRFLMLQSTNALLNGHPTRACSRPPSAREIIGILARSDAARLGGS